MRVTLEEFISSLRESDKRSVGKEITQFVEKTSWFDYESMDRKFLVFTTRRHGDTGTETPGRRDLREADRLKAAISKSFDVKDVEIEVVDEWVSLVIEL